MKTITVVGRHYGENLGTSATPIMSLAKALEIGIDLEAKGIFCRSWDDDGLVESNVFSVLTIDVPDHMTEEYYCINHVQIKYLKGYGADLNWSKEIWDGLMALDNGYAQYLIIKILKTKKFRSEVRKNLKERFESWYKDAYAKRDFAVNYIVDTCSTVYDYRDYKYLSNNLYYAR